jgi:ankyrin repeat protein
MKSFDLVVSGVLRFRLGRGVSEVSAVRKTGTHCWRRILLRSLCMLLLLGSFSVQSQPSEGESLASEIARVRSTLGRQQPALGETELNRLAEGLGRSNYLAHAIPEAILRNDFTNADRLLREFPGTVNDLRLAGYPTTPVLFLIRAFGNDNQVAFLLNHKADPDVLDQRGETPLFDALMYSRWSLALQLVEAGASVNRTNRIGQAPLDLLFPEIHMDNPPPPLSATNPLRTLRVKILEHGADPFASERDRWWSKPGAKSILEFICEGELGESGRADADLLLTNRPSVVKRTPRGDTALHLAAVWGRTNALNFLLSAGFSVNQTNSQGMTALQRIADCNTRLVGHLRQQWDGLNLLWSRKADLNACDSEGNTALHHAAVPQDDTIGHFANVSAWDRWEQAVLSKPSWGQTAMTSLIRWKLVAPPPAPVWTNTSMTAWLLDHGADPDLTNRLGQTPLHVLCQQPWLRQTNGTESATNRLTLLLKAGVRVAARDANGMTCLQLAATNAAPAFLDLLVRGPNRPPP